MSFPYSLIVSDLHVLSWLRTCLLFIPLISLYIYRPRLKEHMQYCMSHPEEMSKLAKVKAQIAEVKGIMMDNIEKVDALTLYMPS